MVAVAAYVKTGGIEDLRRQVKSLGPATEAVRTKAADATGTVRTKAADATEAVRTKTADVLDRLEKVVRGSAEGPPPPAEERKPFELERKPASEEKEKEE